MTIQLSGPRFVQQDFLSEVTALAQETFVGAPVVELAIVAVSYYSPADNQTLRVHFGLVDPTDASAPADVAAAAPVYTRIRVALESEGMLIAGLPAQAWSVRFPGSAAGPHGRGRQCRHHRGE